MTRKPRTPPIPGYPTALPRDYPGADFPTSQALIHADQIQAGDWVHYFGRWVPVDEVATANGITIVTLHPLTYEAHEDVQVCAPLVDRLYRPGSEPV